MNLPPPTSALVTESAVLTRVAAELHLELAALADAGLPIPTATRHALDLELRDLTRKLMQLAPTVHQQRYRAAA